MGQVVSLIGDDCLALRKKQGDWWVFLGARRNGEIGIWSAEDKSTFQIIDTSGNRQSILRMVYQ